MKYRLIVMGASFGGIDAIKTILRGLPDDFKVPVVIVLHIGSHSITTFLKSLNKMHPMKIREAGDKQPIRERTVYFAPPNYHLQLENDMTFSLSADEKVNYSRPSIDVLFETAAWAVKAGLVGVLLTGANQDGAAGLKTIKTFGGYTIVQDPATAVAPNMPEAAINLFAPDAVLPVENIARKILELFSH